MAGMNDVLPKPFTKEGLLSMLEKHLGHLKRLADGIDPISAQQTIPPASVGTSLKDENSPADSPSTMSNWQSPGHFSGISPTQSATSHSYLQPLSAGGYSHDQSPLSYQPPHTPLSGPPSMHHRRQISEMGPDDIGNDQKRPRVYEQVPVSQVQSSRGR